MSQTFEYYKLAPEREKDFVRNFTNMKPNDISLYYFRNDNIRMINNLLIEEIAKLTNKKYGQKLIIKPQKRHLLLTIMRGIYFFHIRDLKGNVKEQVNQLNQLVLENIVPTAYNGLVNHVKYINIYNKDA